MSDSKRCPTARDSAPPDADAAVVAEIRPRLVSIARRVVRHAQDAEEAADEVVARWVREVRRGRAPDNPAAWLQRAVLNLAIDRARAWVRRQRHLDNVSRTPGREPDAPSDRAERSELREAVWRSVLELPPRQRDVIILHELEGLTYTEVATLLGLADATARTHAHAGREALRKKLAHWQGGRT